MHHNITAPFPDCVGSGNANKATDTTYKLLHITQLWKKKSSWWDGYGMYYGSCRCFANVQLTPIATETLTIAWTTQGLVTNLSWLCFSFHIQKPNVVPLIWDTWNTSQNIFIFQTSLFCNVILACWQIKLHCVGIDFYLASTWADSATTLFLCLITFYCTDGGCLWCFECCIPLHFCVNYFHFLLHTCR